MELERVAASEIGVDGVNAPQKLTALEVDELRDWRRWSLARDMLDCLRRVLMAFDQQNKDLEDPGSRRFESLHELALDYLAFEATLDARWCRRVDL